MTDLCEAELSSYLFYCIIYMLLQHSIVLFYFLEII